MNRRPEQLTVPKEPMPEQAVATREKKSVVIEKQLDFLRRKTAYQKGGTGI